MRVLGLLWGFLVDLGVTQAQTHTFPSEISRLSRLRKMSLYLFLLSGAGSSPGGGECHTKPPSTLSTLAGSLESGETERGERYRQKVLTVGSVGWDGGTWAWVGPTQDNPLQKGDSHKCMDSEEKQQNRRPRCSHTVPRGREQT